MEAKMSNKKMGNKFEADFCEELFQHGFWTHNLAQNQAGQPADVIAVKSGQAYLIDCKVCSNGTFQLSRIEENQHMAMGQWEDCNNGNGWFALQIDNEVFMLSYFIMEALSHEKSVLNSDDIREYGKPLSFWLRRK